MATRGAARGRGKGPQDRIKDNCLAAKERKKEVDLGAGEPGESGRVGRRSRGASRNRLDDIEPGPGTLVKAAGHSAN